MKEREKTLFEDSPVLEAIVRLAFPTVIGQIILVLYNMADTFFIGLTGSDAMITAATVCMPAFMFLQAISNLFGVGGASVISRALGARDLQRAKDTASFAFWGCAAVTVLYSLGAWLFAGPFVDLLGGSNPLVHDYARGIPDLYRGHRRSGHLPERAAGASGSLRGPLPAGQHRRGAGRRDEYRAGSPVHVCDSAPGL